VPGKRKAIPTTQVASAAAAVSAWDRGLAAATQALPAQSAAFPVSVADPLVPQDPVAPALAARAAEHADRSLDRDFEVASTRS
jgi:hypothetical protein